MSELYVGNTTDSFLKKSTLWLMTIGAGLIVANNYYNQPLLGMIAKEYKVSEEMVNYIPMLTQIGYALGLLFLIPLGDKYDRKKMIILDFALMIGALGLFVFSPTIQLMFLASLLIGFSSVIPQMFVPIAAQLSKSEEKGKNVGFVMGGLLVGILLSRVFSGFVGEYWGWREMYYIAIGLVAIFGVAIVIVLPNIPHSFTGSYAKLMGSLLFYVKSVPSLRLASIRGALGFGSFMIFWTTITFYLERPPFLAGSDVAGGLGIVGVGGAVAASLVGAMTDKLNKNHIIVSALILMIGAWLIFGFWGLSYAGLILGVFFLDVGLQSMHVTNQTIVFSTHPDATNRLNTVYMFSYFVGGSVGTFMGGKAWMHYGWLGTVVVGLSFVILALLIHLFSPHKYREIKSETN